MLHPGRGLARLLVILAVIAAVVAAVAGWAEGQALDEEGWRSTAEELVADPAIRAALADHLAGEITSAVTVPPLVVAGLPSGRRVDSLRGDSAAAVRGRLATAIEVSLRRPGVQAALTAAMVQTHGVAVEALRGGGPRVDSSGGVVALDLDSFLRAGLEAQIDGGERLTRLLPDDLGRVEIADADNLEPARHAVSRVETAARVAPLVAIALLVLAVVVAGSARRGVMIMAGVLALVAGIGLVLLRSVIGVGIVEALGAEPRYRDAGEAAWGIASGDLARNGVLLAVAGGVLLAAGIALGILRGTARPADGSFGGRASGERDRAGGGGTFGGAGRPRGGQRSDGGARDWSIGSDPRGDSVAQRIGRARELYNGGAMTEAEFQAEVQRIRNEG
ncbi:MAG: hypothetical protein RIB67_07695 [Miltoncostaeaceae bacterium]